jgi:hypothetical protein
MEGRKTGVSMTVLGGITGQKGRLSVATQIARRAAEGAEHRAEVVKAVTSA